MLLRQTRQAAGRDPDPSAALLDAQTVRGGPQAGPRGVDAARKTNGRKRHVLVDTLGLLLVVLMTSANVQDRTGGKLVLAYAKRRFARLKLVWADQRYEHGLVEWVKQWCKWVLEIVRPPEGQRGFRILPRRWVVERSLAWYTRSRRLSRDYEGRARTSESWLYLANIRLMLRRLESTRDPS